MQHVSKMKVRVGALAICGAFIGAVLPNAVRGAIDYPTRVVTILAPFAAGGSSDITARFAAEVLQRHFQKPFVVENRTGAGGNIAAAAVAKSAPDGHMLLQATSAFSTAPYTTKISYDPEADFDPIAIFAITDFILVVSPKLNIRSVRELIDRAKASPNELTYGSAGLGSVNQLFAELFNTTANVKIRHIPYRGTAPALIDVMTGQVSMFVSEMGSALPLIRDGKLTALGVTSSTRHEWMPELPTVAESLPGYEAVGWHGLLARSGTPKEIVNTLNAILNAALKQPETSARFKALSVGLKITTPEESREWVRAQLRLFKKIVADAGMVPP